MQQASDIAQDMFTMAQWSQSSQAAASLELMAARQVKGGGALAALIRERQDLVEDWQAKDKLLIAARVEPAERRNQQTESALSDRLRQIDGRLAEIDKVLAKEFPEYAAATNPEPLTLADAQALLRNDEALVLFFDTRAWQPAPEETFIWVATRTEARWLRSDFGTQALATQVAALRCGLDQTAWDGEGQSRCADLLRGHSRAGTLPFDLTRAHDLYRALFGQAEDLIKDKHLLIVPSGHLTALPFQVLVTTAPKAAIPDSADGYQGAAWLARQHALTVLPSVASLKALRRFARASQAKEPFIGFGNPLLLGPYGTDRSAWEKQACSRSATGTPRVAARGIRAPVASFFRGNLANVELIRSQQPLPETSDELCAVARSVGASERAVYLGEKATETTLKALSKNGTLAGARILHFATHGLLAGETNMVTASRQAEPALILTPPREADRAGRRAAHGFGGHPAQTRRRLGGAVGLQHGGWCQYRNGCRRQHRGAVRPGARLLLCGRAGAARLALGGGFARHGQPRHEGLQRDQGRRQSRSLGSPAPIHAGAHRQRRPQRAPDQLGAVRRRRRGCALAGC